MRKAMTRAAVLLAGVMMAGGTARADDCKLERLLALPVTMEGERASVPVTINGKATTFWLDSGAFFNVMSRAKAAELGLKLESLPFGFTINGIGGSTSAALARVKSLGLDEQKIPDMEFIVGGSDAGNAFLGANLLGAFDTEFDLAHGSVTLFQQKHCDKANLAYWAGDRFVAVARMPAPEREGDKHIYVTVTVNGRQLRAVLDTGATRSSLMRGAARRAGIDVGDAGAQADGFASGIGTHARQRWVAKMDSFEIGGETIQHAPIQVIDEDLSFDMLLGADFLLSHHVLSAPDLHEMFITYNGGPIFRTDTGKMAAVREVAMGGTTKNAEPTDADGFSRRGAARLAQGDTDGAVADLSEAIRRDPAKAGYWRMRAAVYVRTGHADLAKADEVAALKLAPEDARLLLVRARQEVVAGNEAAALSDADAAVALIPKGALQATPAIGLYVDLHRPAQAIAVLDAIIALHVEDHARGELLLRRCWVRALANSDLDKAERDCRSAAHNVQAPALLAAAAALLRFRRNDVSGALTACDAAGATSPNPEFTYLRGAMRKAAGQTEAGDKDIAAATKADARIAAFWAGYGITVQ